MGFKKCFIYQLLFSLCNYNFSEICNVWYEYLIFKLGCNFLPSKFTFEVLSGLHFLLSAPHQFHHNWQSPFVATVFTHTNDFRFSVFFFLNFDDIFCSVNRNRIFVAFLQVKFIILFFSFIFLQLCSHSDDELLSLWKSRTKKIYKIFNGHKGIFPESNILCVFLVVSKLSVGLSLLLQCYNRWRYCYCYCYCYFLQLGEC